MNRSVVFAGGLLALAIIIVGGLSFASAHGWFFKLEKLDAKADILGLSVEELQERRDAGESWRDIAEAQGFSKKDFRNAKHGRSLEQKAELLGISVEDLQTLKDEEKTFDEILGAAGLTQEEFQVKAKAEKIESVQERVTAGDLTQEEADEIIERIESYDNSSGFDKGFHRGSYRFGGHKYFK